jgi:hypothetical protein
MVTTVTVTIPVAIEVVGPLSSREGPHPGKRRHDGDVVLPSAELLQIQEGGSSRRCASGRVIARRKYCTRLAATQKVRRRQG